MFLSVQSPSLPKSFFIGTSVIFGIILLISGFFLIKGLVSGSIKYGYKYYGKGVTANKNADPISYWFGIILYGVIAIVSFIFFLYFLIPVK